VSSEHYDVVHGGPRASGRPRAERRGRLSRTADRSPALLVLTGRDDSSLALTALSFGAQDYLVKGRHDSESLTTAVLHAVQRQRAERAHHLYLQMAKGLLDAIEAPTCAVDAEGRIVTVNSAWRRFAEAAGSDPDLSAEGSDYLEVCELEQAMTDDTSVAGNVASGCVTCWPGVRCATRPSTRATARASTPGSPCGSRPPRSTAAWCRHLPRGRDRHAPGAGDLPAPVPARHADRTAQPGAADRPLERALVDSARQGSDVAVAFLDLDHFKRVNDSLGHPAGDDLLRQVAERLTSAVRQGDTLSRYAGDEFVVLFRDLTDPVDAGLLCDRLLRCFERPFQLGRSDVVVTASIGVVTGRAPQTVDELLLSADASMYDAKARGRGRVRIFSAELRHEAEARLAIETGLRSALAAGQLVLHYQPVVSLVTGRAVGAEALVRWQHPERGLLGPDSFIPVAEATGLILPLGAWVLTRACTDAASWTGALAGLEVAVNLSARQLTQSDVVSQVAGALSTSGLEPSRLLLEVTESAMLEDADAAGRALDALAELGVRIAVDDFGTGYSSLLYLRRYPISVLKIDRAFIAGVASNTDDHAICTSVVTLGHAVDAMTIAEGVETLPQMAALESMGCRRAQGFLWSRGVPLDQLAKAVDRCAAVPVPAASTRLRVPLACTSNDPDTSQ
jgi:diguanylate cyclase (GGDEF)-like protein